MNQEANVFYWLPCPVVFVCTAHGDRRDIMTATAMFVSEKEPLLTVSVAAGHLTDRLMERSGAFTVAIAAEDQRRLATQVGSVKGDAEDKFQRFGIAAVDVTDGGIWVPEGVAAWMHCTVESTHEIRGYRIVTGRVNASGDLNRAPMVWHKDAYFGLRGV